MRFASRAEVEAVFDDRLKAPLPRDQAAENRYTAMSELMTPVIEPRPAASVPESEQFRPYMTAYNENSTRLAKMAHISKSGPLQKPVKEDPIASIMFRSRAIAKVTAGSALGHAALGEQIAAIKHLATGYAIIESIANASASDLDYLASEAVRAILDTSACDIVRSSQLSKQQLESLLVMAPTLDNDAEVRRRCVMAEFQYFLLPKLAQLDGASEAFSIGEDLRQGVGQYDAIETARLLNKLLVIKLENCGRPLSKIDNSGTRLSHRELDGLPEDTSDGLEQGAEKSLRKLWFEIQVNGTRNSLGRLYFAHSFDYSLVESSATSRTHRDLLRGLVAIKLYELRTGTLPESLNQVVSLGTLKREPWDFIADKPLRYSRSQMKLWGVGKNAVDEGGSFSADALPADPDYGISLRPLPKAVASKPVTRQVPGGPPAGLAQR
jgi:hypothetical protein